MFLAIEIGGTKLQLAIGEADQREPEVESTERSMVAVERLAIDRAQGAEGILDQIAAAAPSLIGRWRPRAIGIGFGGPVDAGGRVVTSHQVSGWDQFPLREWTEKKFSLPTVVENDCNVAALAEAVRGAGRHVRRVLYVTVGTGVGGGFVVDRIVQGADCPAVTEIGHLRYGLEAVEPEQTVESFASGLGIERQTRREIELARGMPSPDVQQLLALCKNDLQALSAKQVVSAARAGNQLAEQILQRAARTLGWALASCVTLLAPQAVIVGGGLSLAGDCFLPSVQRWLSRYVFPPLADAYQLHTAALGEQVVLHGAILLAARRASRLPRG